MLESTSKRPSQGGALHRNLEGKPHEQVRMLRLGQIVRSTRKGRFTVEELSERAGVSSGLISQIERGQGNPSFKTMQRLAAALALPIGALFQDDAATLSMAVSEPTTPRIGSADLERKMIVRRDARKQLVFPKESMVWELLTPDLNRNLEMLRAVVPADYDTREVPFIHTGEECVHVIRGTLEMHLDEHVFRINAGDTITYDAGVPHWWRNVGDSEAEVISACTPPSF
jgi:transcriptional regulator with XRE-family HTH domain